MRKVIALLFCFLFVVTSVPSVCAIEKPSNELDVNAGREEWILQVEDGQEILFNPGTGETISEAHRIVNGQVISVSLRELCDALNSALSEESPTIDLETYIPDDSATRRASLFYFYRLENVTTKRVNGGIRKVTQDYKGPTELSLVTSVTITDSYGCTGSGGAAISLSSKAKTTISASASFSWNYSLATGTSVESSYCVSAGKTGHIEFIPYLNQINGDLYEAFSDPVTGFTTDYVYKGKAWGRSPIQLPNGLADGLFYLVEK